MHACKRYDPRAQTFKINATQRGHHETLTLKGPRSSMYGLHAQFLQVLPGLQNHACLFIVVFLCLSM